MAAQVVVPIELVPGDEGLYWFDVTLRGRLVTRVPLRVQWKT